MTGLARHLSRIVNAETVDQVWNAHVEKMAEYGFDRLLYGYTRFRNGESLGDLRDAIILTNHSPEYMREYIDRGLYRHGPLLCWALNNVGPVSWRRLSEWEAAGQLGPKSRAVLRLNRGMGLLAGYTISFKEVSPRYGGAIGLCARPGLDQDAVDTIWERSGEEILTINNVTHLRLTQLPHPGSRHLTPRQREVLEWVADGKTTQDVAELLGLTPGTVEKHLRRARDVLDAETTAQAILKAIMRNEFFSP